jgi:photosystem II stability/assembly factor-like uncharacterized protein
MPFDTEVDSTTVDAVVDYSGSGNHGQLGGGISGYAPAWTSAGIKGGAYAFDGVDDYIGGSSLSGIDFSQDYTLELWFNADEFGISGSGCNDDRAVLISKEETGELLNLVTTAGAYPGRIGLLHSDTGENSNATYTSTALNTGQWYYVAAVHDASERLLAIYVDGSEDVTHTYVQGETLDNPAGPLYIGAKTVNCSPDEFDGTIDEIRVYDFALSAEQIAQNYNNGKPLYNTIVAEEISEADVSWVADVIINDAQDYRADSSFAVCSVASPSNSEPLMSTPTVRAHAPVTSDSVGYWQFEDGDISVAGYADDETTNENDGTCTNCPAWTENGAIGGAYEFDGVDDMISIPNSTSLDIYGVNQPVSLSAWVKFDEYSSTIFVHKGEYPNYEYGFGSTPNGRVDFRINDAGEFIIVQGALAPDLGKWYHYVGVYDGMEMRIYKNGVSDSTPTAHSGTVNQHTGPLTIGKYAYHPTAYNFNGSVDEVRVYDRVLTASEISALYNSSVYAYDSYDLGASTVGMVDADGDDTFATVDWRAGGTSMAVLNMSFDEKVTALTADSVQDYSSYANHGQLGAGTAGYAPAWRDSATCGLESGGCYEFDGDDMISISDADSLDIDSTFTIEAWVKPDDFVSREIVSKNGNFRLLFSSFGDPTFSYYSNGEWRGFWDDVSTFTAGNWYYIVATGDGQTQRLYVDGIETNTASYTDPLVPNVYNLEIGSYAGIRTFDGLIDEVRIYDSALSADQIAMNYNAGKPNHLNLAAAEVDAGDSWTAEITPHDADGEAGTTIESEAVEVLGFTAGPVESWEGPDGYLLPPAWHVAESGSTEHLKDIDLASDTVFYAVGETGTILKSADGGQNWSAQTSGVTEDLWSIFCTSASVCWAVGEDDGLGGDAVILYTSNGGTDWTEQTSGTTKVLYDVFFASTTRGWAVGETGTILTTSNAGTTWTAQTSGVTNNINGVYAVSDLSVWAVGTGGVILTTTNGGTSWANSTISSSSLYDVKFLDDQIGFVSGLSGKVYYTTNGGTNWTLGNTGTGTAIFGIDFSDASNGVLVGGGGNYGFSSNGGATWTVHDSDAADTFFEVESLNADEYWAVGMNGAIAYTTTAARDTRNSSDNDPTQAGQDIDFIATYNSGGGAQWYLAVCKYAYAVPGDDSAPSCCTDSTYSTCTSAEAWAISGYADDGAEATATYTTSSSDAESNTWYAFGCDKVAGGGSCSTYSQGENHSGSPFVVNHQPAFADNFSVSDLSSDAELLADGDMELAGYSDWTSWLGATLSKETTDPHGGSQVLRVEGGAAQQSVVGVSVGNKYRITGYARSSSVGDAYPVIHGSGNNLFLWTGTHSTDWQYIETDFMAVAPTIGLWSWAGESAGEYVEFDDMSIVRSPLLEPGERLRFDFEVTDSNGDDVTVVVCDEVNFAGDYYADSVMACWGEELCRVTIPGGGTGYCNETDTDVLDTDTDPVYIAQPEAHGSKTYTVHAFDEHYVHDDSTTNSPEAQTLSVEDMNPYPISYTMTDGYDPVAGSSDGVIFTIRYEDTNGGDDVTNVIGYFKSGNAVSLACTANENNCYVDASCTLDSGVGTANQVDAVCSADVWYNADSGSWYAWGRPTDDNGTINFGIYSSVVDTVAELSAVNVAESSIDYGFLRLGTTSAEQTVTLQNLGNTVIDVGIQGADMTSASGTIPRANQEWSDSSGFAFGGGNPLVETAGTGGAVAGCYDGSLAVRSAHDSTAADETLYWLLQAPLGLPAGTYTGSSTMSVLTCD